jgi:hypothetical protein
MRPVEPETTMSNMWKGPNRMSATDSETPFTIPSPRTHTSTPTKGVTLRKSRLVPVAAVLAVAALAAGSALAGTAASAKIITFTSTYAGAANVTVSDDVATLAAAGPGKATTTGVAPVPKFGVGKLVGAGTSSADKSAGCQTFNGTGSLTGLAGAKLNYKITGAQACGDSETGPWSISGRATVTGGTGAYKKAKGSLKVTGVYNGSEKKTFSVKFVGKLTV